MQGRRRPARIIRLQPPERQNHTTCICNIMQLNYCIRLYVYTNNYIYIIYTHIESQSVWLGRQASFVLQVPGPFYLMIHILKVMKKHANCTLIHHFICTSGSKGTHAVNNHRPPKPHSHGWSIQAKRDTERNSSQPVINSARFWCTLSSQSS